MAKSINLSIRVAPETKAEALIILAEKGMTMSEFVRQAIRSLNVAKAIPFPVKASDLQRR